MKYIGPLAERLVIAEGVLSSLESFIVFVRWREAALNLDSGIARDQL